MSNFASEVRSRASGRCEYCHIPEAAFRRPFHIEHVVAKQHGGRAQFDNLALACWACNLKKGPNLAGIDPETGEVTTLFNPRKHQWKDHFVVVRSNVTQVGIEIKGRTPIGRTTVCVLDMNSEMRRRIRHELWQEGLAAF